MCRLLILFISILVLCVNLGFAQDVAKLTPPYTEKNVEAYWELINNALTQGEFQHANNIAWPGRIKTIDAFITGGGRFNHLSLFVLGPMPNNSDSKAAAIKLVHADLTDRNIILNDEQIAWLVDNFILDKHVICFFERTNHLTQAEFLQLIQMCMFPEKYNNNKTALLIYPRTTNKLHGEQAEKTYNHNLIQTYLQNGYFVKYVEVATVYELMDCIDEQAKRGSQYDVLDITGDGDSSAIFFGKKAGQISDFSQLGLEDNVLLSDLTPALSRVLKSNASVFLNGRATAQAKAYQLNFATLMSTRLQDIVQNTKRTIEVFAPSSSNYQSHLTFSPGVAISYTDLIQGHDVTFHKTLVHKIPPTLTHNDKTRKEKLTKQYCVALDDIQRHQLAYQLCQNDWYDEAAIFGYKNYLCNVESIHSQYFRYPENYLNILRSHFSRSYNTNHMTFYEVMRLMHELAKTRGGIESLKKDFGVVPDNLMGQQFANLMIKKHLNRNGIQLKESEYAWLAERFVVGRDLRDQYILKRTKTLSADQLRSMIQSTQIVLSGQRPSGKLVLMVVNSRDHNKAFNSNNLKLYLDAGYQVCYVQVETESEFFYLLKGFAESGIWFDGIDLGGHGSHTGIIWGAAYSFDTAHRDEDANYGAIGIDDRALFAQLTPYLVKLIPKNGFVILDSCATAEPNKGQEHFAGYLAQVFATVAKQNKTRIDIYGATSNVNICALTFKNDRVYANFYQGVSIFSRDYTVGFNYTYHAVVD